MVVDDSMVARAILSRMIAANPDAVDKAHPGQTLVLRADKDGDDGSVYRYDRAGLIKALKSASSGGKGR